MMLIYTSTRSGEVILPCQLRLCANGRDCLLRLRLRLCFGHKFLPIAALFEAGVHGADLGAFFDNERRAALRTRFRDGHVGRGEIAVRVTRAAVEDTWAPAATLTGAAAAHKFAFIAFRTFDAHGEPARVLAIRVTLAC